MFFWLIIVGGLLIAVSWFFDPGGIVSGIGVVLFLSGLASFFYFAFRDARAQGTTFGRAVRSSAADALRLAWLLMP